MDGLDAATLVHRHVHDNRAGTHELQVFLGDEVRGLGARDEHRADDQVRVLDLLPDGVPGGEQAAHVGRHHVVQVTEPVEVDVHDGHPGAETGGHLGGVGSHDAATEDQDLARKHAGDAAQQDAQPTLGLLQVLGAFLHRHAAGDLGHGGEEGKLAGGQLHRLIGDGDGLGREERLGELLVGGEVEVREEDLTLPDLGPLGTDGLLHLHDHLGAGPDLVGRGHDLAAGGLVEVVGEATAEPGVGLDDDLVTGTGKGFRAGRGERDAVFVGLDLFGYADEHFGLASEGSKRWMVWEGERGWRARRAQPAKTRPDRASGPVAPRDGSTGGPAPPPRPRSPRPGAPGSRSGPGKARRTRRIPPAGTAGRRWTPGRA